ncbi:response regulator transcription factor [Lederbergia wuyishanensis]|uniref:DNA-binding response OmpR family regulator n=1 Tax=Lederbergia wuyishanensis TaxID=1347903 RepID=A0ABU0D307_9BACI|nr:response regulator transcription factor [Lederbergia wuyishanensis]MCJ8007070.1 response regulator transcription factor [Lederbergia wuyishanensis]MDQ0342786.1 DNA-binding response OmpR family regulator [Lederbergia wuyishanensis]
MYKVLIIEDDHKLRNLIGQYLAKWSFLPVLVENFEFIDQIALKENPHIILLDINLPGNDGFYWCSKLRQLSDVPIIFISSRSQSMDIVIAMNMGGDDYIQKPFSLEVLVAKMNAVLRRSNFFQHSEKDILTVGELTLNLQNSFVESKGKKVSLTKNEFQILYLLMKKTGQIISRDEIMRALWEDEQFIDDNTLTVNVNRLRKKLEEIGVANAITTKKRQGYLLQ